jgi:excinuclease ABC subunit C
MQVAEELRNAILNLPMSPGIYQFFDKNDKLLYVGKAKRLNAG